ncbi:hypothetical protein SDC9_13785 [bioreactor metagenome]|uniref:Transposase IS200-like domain-containing protein n=1 Tax=bioreactor metagenome TaxID=1076179 RepID=A0A644TP63_9ZZZZ|nr:transposase [Negativicutes bacterium]
MPRAQRVHFFGAVYHVIARGNNQEDIFKGQSDKRYYLNLLQKYKKKYPYSLYAYVLMDNHVHLLISVMEDPLSKIMQGVQQSYTQYFNNRYSHLGHIFQQRYKAILCNNDSYLITLMRYIHQNPVRAGISNGLDYHWSSHKAYLRGDDNLVETDFVFNMLSSDREVALQQYLEIMSNGDVQKSELVDGYITYETDQKPNHNTTIMSNITISQLLDTVAQETGIEQDRILSEKGKRAIVYARNLFIYSAIKKGVATKTELASFLGISLPSVIKGYNLIQQHQK